METNVPIPDNKNAIITNEAQLVLAEKRTHLAFLRTGIAIMALPMTFASFLIATSSFNDFADALFYLIPLFILSSVPLWLGGGHGLIMNRSLFPDKDNPCFLLP